MKEIFFEDSDYNISVRLRFSLSEAQREKLKTHMQKEVDLLIPQEHQSGVFWFYQEPYKVSEEDPLGQYGVFGWRYVHLEATTTFRNI